MLPTVLCDGWAILKYVHLTVVLSLCFTWVLPYAMNILYNNDMCIFLLFTEQAECQQVTQKAINKQYGSERSRCYVLMSLFAHVPLGYMAL
jgi:hypothetical protein